MVVIMLDFVCVNYSYIAVLSISNMLIIHRYYQQYSVFDFFGPLHIQLLINLSKGLLSLPNVILKVINLKSIFPSTFYNMLHL